MDNFSMKHERCCTIQSKMNADTIKNLYKNPSILEITLVKIHHLSVDMLTKGYAIGSNGYPQVNVLQLNCNKHFEASLTK